MASYKYGVGDTVTVRKDLERGVWYNMESGEGPTSKAYATERMCRHAGQTIMISEIEDGAYHADGFGRSTFWTDGMFESDEDLQMEEVSEDELMAILS